MGFTAQELALTYIEMLKDNEIRLMEAFLSAWGWFMDPLALIAMFGGTIVGFVFRVLPGLGGITATALFLPFIYGMNPMIAMSLHSMDC